MLKALRPIDVALIKKIGGNGSSYTLPIATETTLGGVKPVTKTDAMTQSVGVDAGGALWTAPGSGEGGGWRSIGNQVMDGEETAVAFDCNDECILMISILGLTEVMGATTVVLSLVHQSGKSENFYTYTLNSGKFSPKNTFLIYGKSRNRAMISIKGESSGYSGNLGGYIENGTDMDENYKFDPVTSVVVTFNSAPVSGVRVVVEGM